MLLSLAVDAPDFVTGISYISVTVSSRDGSFVCFLLFSARRRRKGKRLLIDQQKERREQPALALPSRRKFGLAGACALLVRLPCSGLSLATYLSDDDRPLRVFSSRSRAQLAAAQVARTRPSIACPCSRSFCPLRPLGATDSCPAPERASSLTGQTTSPSPACD